MPKGPIDDIVLELLKHSFNGILDDVSSLQADDRAKGVNLSKKIKEVCEGEPLFIVLMALYLSARSAVIRGLRM